MTIQERWFKNVRKEYRVGALPETQAGVDPVQLFSLWYEDALKELIREPNAMALATVGDKSIPSVRIVLMKDFSTEGLVFFTHYQSQKGKELALNPYAAALFFWDKLERQVRVEGPVSRVSRQESEQYFQSRPRGAQISAVISQQSAVVESRSVLEKGREYLEKEYTGKSIPCPAEWGGYKLEPVSFEFWQGRADKLHDRIRFVKESEQAWRRERLAP